MLGYDLCMAGTISGRLYMQKTIYGSLCLWYVLYWVLSVVSSIYAWL